METSDGKLFTLPMFINWFLFSTDWHVRSLSFVISAWCISKLFLLRHFLVCVCRSFWYCEKSSSKLAGSHAMLLGRMLIWHILMVISLFFRSHLGFYFPPWRYSPSRFLQLYLSSRGRSLFQFQGVLKIIVNNSQERLCTMIIFIFYG